MAIPFYSDIDLNGNEIQNYKIQSLTQAPENPLPGQQYYNNSDNTLYYFNGTDWVQGGSSGSGEGQVALKQASINIENPIEANTDYSIPLNYIVGADDLEIFYCGNKLQKDVDYIEIGDSGSISNKIQFKTNIGDLDMSGIVGFESFEETLQFAITGKTPIPIETINNENGTAIKFSDGTMICTLNNMKILNQEIKTLSGAGIYVGTYTWNFPMPFIDKPSVSCGMFKWGTSSSWGGVLGINPTYSSLAIYDTYEREAGAARISTFAIGHWK